MRCFKCWENQSIISSETPYIRTTKIVYQPYIDYYYSYNFESNLVLVLKYDWAYLEEIMNSSNYWVGVWVCVWFGCWISLGNIPFSLHGKQYIVVLILIEPKDNWLDQCKKEINQKIIDWIEKSTIVQAYGLISWK